MSSASIRRASSEHKHLLRRRHVRHHCRGSGRDDWPKRWNGEAPGPRARAGRTTDREVELDLTTEPALGADRVAVADQEHPDHQLGIDRGTSRVTVERREIGPQPARIESGVDPAQQMIRRNAFLEIEFVDQPILSTTVAAIAISQPDDLGPNESRRHNPFNRVLQRPQKTTARMITAPERHRD